MPAPRKARIAEALRLELSEIIRREMRDPRLSEGLLSITGVDVSSDLRYATVFISVLGDQDAQQHVTKALQGASGVLRNELRARKAFKNVPELSFQYDDSIARAARIFTLLEESKRESELHPIGEDTA
jgi:ribosome-binding factor A